MKKYNAPISIPANKPGVCLQDLHGAVIQVGPKGQLWARTNIHEFVRIYTANDNCWKCNLWHEHGHITSQSNPTHREKGRNIWIQEKEF